MEHLKKIYLSTHIQPTTALISGAIKQIKKLETQLCLSSSIIEDLSGDKFSVTECVLP